MLKRIVPAGVVALLLVSPWVVSAHNIDLAKAWELTRDYARLVRKESNGKYLHYATSCVSAFPGHNHIVRCVVQYQNKKDTAAGVYTCKETIEVYMKAHSQTGGNEDYGIFARHTSNSPCGDRKLSGDRLE